MTLIILIVLFLGLFLIATSRITNINKAAVAIFMGTVGWVLYVSYGSDFIMSAHPGEYIDFLNGTLGSSTTVKEYIAQYVFMKYVGQAAEIVLFLLATMTIVEVLDNNGCFDFINALLKTRRSRKLLWTLAAVTFLLSANLDNLTTTILMLTLMHRIVNNRRQRMALGATILISATCGGALTVIGDPVGLVLWNMGAIEATNYSLSLLLPCLVAWALPVWLIGRTLPERVDCQWMAMPYRGDDTRLRPWQRLLMLFVGIGGLWFIPSFHNITKLSPFLGALCVLSVLWIVNELVNRKLLSAGQLDSRRPQILKYGVIQMMLYVMGIMLMLGVVRETGTLQTLSSWWEEYVAAWCRENHINDIWISGILSGMMGGLVDSFASAMSFISMDTVEPLLPSVSPDAVIPDFRMQYAVNGLYWKVVAYCSAMGGNLLAVGSVSGMALLKMEHMHVGWYLKNVGWKAVFGALAGLVLMWAMSFLEWM